MKKGIIIDDKDIIKQNSNGTVFKQNDSKLPLISVKDNNPDVYKSFVKATTSETMKKSVNNDIVSALKSERKNAETISAKKVYSHKLNDDSNSVSVNFKNEKADSISISVSQKNNKVSTPISVSSKNGKSSIPISVSSKNDKVSTPISVSSKNGKSSTPIPVSQKNDKVSTPISVSSENGKALTDNRGIGNQDKPKLKQPQNQTYSKSQKSFAKHNHGSSFQTVRGTKSTINKTYAGVEGAAFNDENMRTFIATRNTAKAIVKSPKAIYRTAKTAVKAPYKTAKAGVKATKATVKVAYSTAKVAVKAAVAVISFVITNLPIILTVLAVALVVVSIISIFTSIFSNISLKSDDVELTKAYSYMTQLDSELTAEIVNIQLVSGKQIQIFVNGNACNINDFEIKTDVDVALAWFDAEYEDYAFDAIIYGLFGGTNIKEEIELIWEDLYSYETKEVYDENTEENILQINVNAKSFDSFAESNVPKNKQSFEFMKDIGVFTSKSEISKPFKFDSILNRYGYYCRPVTKKFFGKEKTSLWIFEHPGVDLKADEGTEVKTGISGTITYVGYSDEYGNCVHIKSKNSKSVIYYAKLKDISVKKDEKVKQGDVIGYVGNTGTSCSEFGACLHVEYYKNSKNVVPSMYFK